MIYSQEDREQARKNSKKTRTLIERVEGISTGRIIQTPEFAAGLAALTDTTDLEAQHRALTEMCERLESSHRERLIEASRDDLSAFAEVMAPHEIPARHHLFLAEQLMRVGENPRERLLVSMPPGHAKDLDVNTLVMMGDGSWKRLGDVKVGEFVMTHLGRPREVLAVHDQGVRPVLCVKTETGRQINAHPEHPFLTPTGWIEAQHLKVGRALAIPMEFEFPGKRSGTQDEFIFLGYMFARAIVTGRSYSRLHRLTTKFRCDDPAIMGDIRDSARRLGFRLRQHKKNATYGMPTVMLTFDDACRDWLEENDVYQVEKRNLRVPEWVFQGTDVEICSFLGAIISCDAQFVPTVNKQTGKQRKMILSIRDNPGLASDLQRLFMRIGVKANFETSRSTNYNYDYAMFFKVTVTDTPSMEALKRRLRIVGATQRIWSEEEVVVTEWPSSHYHTDRIVDIQRAPDTETRCLTVEEDSSFLADGIVVHNSTYSSRYFPAWYLGREEHRKYIQAGHTQKFAEEEFGKKTRDIINTLEYNQIFPGVGLRHDSKAAGSWRLTNGNTYVTKGVGQNIAGFRSTCNGVDDPYASYESAQSETVRRKTWDWFSNDFMTRLLPMGSAMIVATRWHLDDLCGRIEEMKRNGELKDDWEIINLPAFCMDAENDALCRLFGEPLWPDFYTVEALLRQKALMSNTQWACLYEGSPMPAEGNLIKKDWIVHSTTYPTLHMTKKTLSIGEISVKIGQNRSRYAQNRSNYIGGGPKLGAGTPRIHPGREESPVSMPGTLENHSERDESPISMPGTLENHVQAPIPFRRTVVSVDSAESEDKRADFSAITIWRETPNYYHYLCHALRGRWDFNDLITNVEELAIAWEADFILMEKKGAGMQYIQARGNTGLAPCPVIEIDPSKKGSKTFRMDGVSPIFQQKRVILPERAIWLGDYEREILEFPGSKHDDYADSTSQYLSWIRANTGFTRGAKKMG